MVRKAALRTREFIEFEAALLIIKKFSTINNWKKGPNPMLDIQIDDAVDDALVFCGIVHPKPIKSLTLKEKFINFFKPNKGSIAPF